jgi:hypothetical protein
MADVGLLLYIHPDSVFCLATSFVLTALDFTRTRDFPVNPSGKTVMYFLVIFAAAAALCLGTTIIMIFSPATA